MWPLSSRNEYHGETRNSAIFLQIPDPRTFCLNLDRREKLSLSSPQLINICMSLLPNLWRLNFCQAPAIPLISLQRSCQNHIYDAHKFWLLTTIKKFSSFKEKRMNRTRVNARADEVERFYAAVFWKLLNTQSCAVHAITYCTRNCGTVTSKESNKKWMQSIRLWLIAKSSEKGLHRFDRHRSSEWSSYFYSCE